MCVLSMQVSKPVKCLIRKGSDTVINASPQNLGPSSLN